MEGGCTFRQPTTGEKLAGVGFNPSGDVEVADIKRKAADFLDAIDAAARKRRGALWTDEMFATAMRRAVDAQMWAVKAVTFGSPLNFQPPIPGTKGE